MEVNEEGRRDGGPPSVNWGRDEEGVDDVGSGILAASVSMSWSSTGVGDVEGALTEPGLL